MSRNTVASVQLLLVAVLENNFETGRKESVVHDSHLEMHRISSACPTCFNMEVSNP